MSSPALPSMTLSAELPTERIIAASANRVLDHHAVCDGEATEDALGPRNGSPGNRIAEDEARRAQVDRGVQISVIADGVGPAGVPDAAPARACCIDIRQHIRVRAGAVGCVGTVEELGRRDIERHRRYRPAVFLNRCEVRSIIVRKNGINQLVVTEVARVSAVFVDAGKHGFVRLVAASRVDARARGRDQYS